MENIPQWIGVDVSKATLDVYIRPIGKAFQVANTEIEISNLVKQLKIYDVNLIVLEATGGLETELIIQLQSALLPVALINPRQQYYCQNLETLLISSRFYWVSDIFGKIGNSIGQGRDFAKATGKLAKTDAIDAQTLAHFGEAMKPLVLPIESETARQLGELISRRRQLVEMSTAEKNRRDRSRGKPKKLALTACVHKMLVILNAMVRDHLPWGAKDNLQPA